jgi:hypothetical protein
MRGNLSTDADWSQISDHALKGVFGSRTKWNGMSWFRSRGMEWFRSRGMEWFRSCVRLGLKNRMERFYHVFGWRN